MNDTARPFLLGFFGAPNFGDELLCRSSASLFGTERGANVATRSAAVTKGTLTGIKARLISGKYPHVGFWLGLPSRLASLFSSSSLIVGGGGLIQDVYSRATILTSAFDAAIAVLRGLPYAFVGIEIGEATAPRSRRLIRFCLENASVVWCRDQQSVDRATIHASSERILLAPDLAHPLLADWGCSAKKTVDDHCVVNVRALPQVNPEAFRGIVAMLCQRFSQVTLASAQPGEEREWLAVLDTVEPNLRVFVASNWEEALLLLNSSSTVIAERFHFISAGAHLGLTVLPIVSTYKAEDLADQLGIPETQRCSVASWSMELFTAGLDSAAPCDKSQARALVTPVLDAAAHVKRTLSDNPVRVSWPQRRTAAWVLVEAFFFGVVHILSALRRRAVRRLAR